MPCFSYIGRWQPVEKANRACRDRDEGTAENQGRAAVARIDQGTICIALVANSSLRKRNSMCLVGRGQDRTYGKSSKNESNGCRDYLDVEKRRFEVRRGILAGADDKAG